MAKLLQFRGMVPPVAAVATAGGEAPPPDAARYTDPMRRMVDRKCQACGNEWRQPATTGACPRCHSAQTVSLGAIKIYAKRV